MPVVIKLNGVKISIFSNDHVPPHIHAYYGEYEAQVDLRSKEILHGTLPKNKYRIVKDYLQDNTEELLQLFYELNPNIERI